MLCLQSGICPLDLCCIYRQELVLWIEQGQVLLLFLWDYQALIVRQRAAAHLLDIQLIRRGCFEVGQLRFDRASTSTSGKKPVGLGSPSKLVRAVDEQLSRADEPIRCKICCSSGFVAAAI